MMLYPQPRFRTPGGIIDNVEPLRAGPGSTGVMVGTIQGLLLFFGAHRPSPNQAQPLGVDSVYGPETAAAVRDFQGVNGLHVDGVVGPETSTALQNSDSKPIGGQTLSPVDGGSTAKKGLVAVLILGGGAAAYHQRENIARFFKKKG